MGQGVGGRSSLHGRWVSGWVRLTVTLHESGLSHAYTSHWEHKVVPLTAENGF